MVWGTNMAAVLLFRDTNMAAVTSCENTKRAHVISIYANLLEQKKFLHKKKFNSHRIGRSKAISELLQASISKRG